MIKRFFIRLIKIIMMATPFLSMCIMLLALWGVVGKATYTDVKSPHQPMEFSMGEAKNMLVNEVKKDELCATKIEPPTVAKEEEGAVADKDQLPEKIDWEHVI